MTIAAGFPYQGGILLCADTQHEGGATKLFSAKIGLIDCPVGKIGFAYAGNAAFAVSAIQKCSTKMRNVSKLDRMVPGLEEVIAREYRRTVYAHPDRNSDWQIPYSLLFAVWRKDSQSWLFATHETTLRNVLEFQCIGIGSDVANYLIAPTYTNYLSEANAIYLATFMLSQVSLYVPGCGGPLHILVLRDNGVAEFIGPGKIAAIAESTKEFEFRSQRLLYSSLNQDMPDFMFDQEVKAFGGWIGKRRAEFRKATVQHPQPTTSAK
jgi:20S proteasome alpha/beta subunit